MLSRLVKVLGGAVMLWLAGWPCAAAELLLLSAPQPAATAAQLGVAYRFCVYGLNRGAVPLTVQFPETVPCRVAAAVGAQLVTAKLVPGQTLPATLQPGMFAQAEYEFTPPPGLAGPCQVEVCPPAAVTLPPATAAPVIAAGAGQGRVSAGGGRLTDKRLDVFRNFAPYETNYFIVGPKAPTTRFQLSFKFSVLGERADTAVTDWLGRPHVAYTQISLWDWSAPSAPFYDTSYKPELFMLKENVPLKLPGVRTWDFQYGVQHESNGKGINDSRSLNLVYIKPIFHFGDPDRLNLTLAPRIYEYIADMSDNRDMDDYRGNGELTAKLGWDAGLMLSALVRAGNGFKNGGTQIDLSYPLHRLPGCENVSSNLYLFIQYFSGYGESLLDYNHSATGIRAGFAISR